MAWKKIVDSSFTINGKALEGPIDITKEDVGLGNVDNISREQLIASLTADDIPIITISKVTGLQGALDAKVPTSRTIAGKPLTADISLAKADVGLASVENKSPEELSTLIRSQIVADDVPLLEITKINGLADFHVVLASEISSKVSKTTTINGQALDANISLGGQDIIRPESSLPASGSPGEMIRFSGNTYIWKA
jgi:hypothetical protein